jgi:hypothetical protein
MTNAERQKKYREKRNAERNKLVKIVTEKVESVTVPVTECPKEIDPKEWRHACDRAERAKRYAIAMPEFVSERDLRFQDPMWQWENEVRGRFGDVVGGSLSGSRP